jgi:toxin YoeB
LEITFSPKALEHLNFWKKSGNKSVQKKIHELIDSLQTTPFEGIGQPEALKHNLSGYWSRRINKQHRLIYQVKDKEIEITSLKDHY